MVALPRTAIRQNRCKASSKVKAGKAESSSSCATSQSERHRALRNEGSALSLPALTFDLKNGPPRSLRDGPFGMRTGGRAYFLWQSTHLVGALAFFESL